MAIIKIHTTTTFEPKKTTTNDKIPKKNWSPLKPSEMAMIERRLCVPSFKLSISLEYIYAVVRKRPFVLSSIGVSDNSGKAVARPVNLSL